jgi:Phospholipid-translocating ATPase N-terminal
MEWGRGRRGEGRWWWSECEASCVVYSGGGNAEFASNYISMTKYSTWKVVPQFQFELFTRCSNPYFLFVGILYLVVDPARGTASLAGLREAIGAGVLSSAADSFTPRDLEVDEVGLLHLAIYH